MIIKYIGLSGKKGAGKDTAANALYRALTDYYSGEPVFVMKTSYALPLKMAVAGIFNIEPIDDHEVFSREMKDAVVYKGKTVGEMLQLVGTEVFRSWDERFWVNLLFENTKKIAKELESAGYETMIVIVTDVRMQNELREIELHGGAVIRIEREFTIKDGRCENHKSEVDLDGVDYRNVIYNSAGIEDLQESVSKLVINKILHTHRWHRL